MVAWKDQPTDARVARPTDDRSNGEANPRLDRRSCLRLGAVTAVAALGTSAASAVSAEEEDREEDDADETEEEDAYEIVTIPENTHENIAVHGETYENVLIDVSNAGASVQLTVQNGTVRNVGILGEQSSDAPNHSWMVVQASAGEEVRVENVYMGDGLDGDYGGGGIFVHANHAGECVIDRVHVAGSGDNGIYASGPGTPNGNDGHVVIRDCLSINSTVSLYRIGSTGSVIENCVGWVDEDTPQYRNPGSPRTSRGVWHWYATDCEVYDVDIDMKGRGAAILASRDGGHLHVHDSEIDGGDIAVDHAGNGAGEVTTDDVTDEPELEPPEGVPMSAEEAAAGDDE